MKPASLCFPDKAKSCFACCPPIRPAGYEHIQHLNSVKRFLRENRQAFDSKDKTLYPITGFSCWALGYISDDYKLVGCMLHPARNGGVDLRYRVNYGDKCRRESCQEETVFSGLDDNERAFWLPLADGLDSFAYSSREINPLFKMMGWGADLLKIIALNVSERIFTRDSFFSTFPLFTPSLKPRANAYLLNRLVDKGGFSLLSEMHLREKLERFSAGISKRLMNEYTDFQKGSYTHTLDLDPAFSDFLRLSAGISRIEIKEAIAAKNIVDYEVDIFLENIY
jgi:hypothetical protein